MKKLVISLMGVFIFLNILIMTIPFTQLLNFKIPSSIITGKGSFGTIGLVILGPGGVVTIDSPENRTYNFSIGADYIIDLNVSADFSVDVWRYKLEDLRHGTTVNESVIFTPNTTINAVRWSNRLTVYANDSSGTTSSSSVVFYVSVPNSAPILENISSEILVCESSSLSHNFNVTDLDEDTLVIDLNPKNPFFVAPSTFFSAIKITSRIFSGTLMKNEVGIYDEILSVSDGEYVDTKNTNITVIEINNPPSVGNIGVQTVWTQGDNSSFYREVRINDIENGNQTSGNFSINLTFLSGSRFFDIDNNGIMNFTANESILGIYNLSFCVTDMALENISQNISFCGQDGLNQTSCQNFSITITNQNRAPTILSYYPSNLTQIVQGTNSLFFNVTEYDPDGTIPDAYWYVDNQLKEYDAGNSYNSFTYSFGCGVSGDHTIEVEITDGELNDSIEWDIDVNSVECPQPGVEGSGGGGGGGGGGCSPNWVCNNWGVCQNAQKSLEVGVLSGEDYRNVDDSCAEQDFESEFCGVQIRSCFDLNVCNKSIAKPSEFQGCYFVEKPSCFDKIKNCHSGGCELLVDCGGPCNKCSTCSDGIKNQGENGIDCGGPCPWQCPAEKPLAKKTYNNSYLIILTILIILIIIKIISVIRLRKKLKE